MPPSRRPLGIKPFYYARFSGRSLVFGSELNALLAEARALRPDVDPQALPILLPALSLGGMAPWRKPLAYWWAARTGRARR